MRQLIIAYFFALVTPLMAQNADRALQHALDSLLDTKAISPDEPGFAVCIVRNGGIVYERQFGLADRERKRPMTAATSFNFGSVSKQFTAAAILLLEEQGKLRRSDPIHRYIPELPDFGHTITIDHLIGHTSGIHSLPEVMALQGNTHNKRLTLDYLLNWLKRRPVLAFEPGSNFSYSNSGYMLLLLIVERASGMSADAYMKQNIFEPLGMRDTRLALHEKDGIIDGTPSYFVSGGKRKMKKAKVYINAMGATGVHGTLRDLAAWQINFDQNRLGKGGPEWVKNMTTPYAVRTGASTHYGAGLAVKQYRGIPTVEHGGGWNGFLTQCRRFPQQGISVLIASNNDKYSPFPIADAVSDLLLGLQPDQRQDASQLAALPVAAVSLEGAYLSFKNHIRYVRLSGDTLRIVPYEAPKRSVVLQYIPESGSDTALIFKDLKNGFSVRFVLDQSRQVKGFYWEGGDYFVLNRFFEKLEDRPLATRKKAGRYRSDLFKRNIAIRPVRGSGDLRIKPVFFLRYRLERVTDSVYIRRDDGIVIRFTEKGLILGDNWVHGIKFWKR